MLIIHYVVILNQISYSLPTSILSHCGMLAPSKEKQISPDGNCLFSSLSYVITGSDYYHKEISELLVRKMKNEFRTVCTNYCSAHYDFLPEQH